MDIKSKLIKKHNITTQDQFIEILGKVRVMEVLAKSSLVTIILFIVGGVNSLICCLHYKLT